MTRLRNPLIAPNLASVVDSHAGGWGCLREFLRLRALPSNRLRPSLEQFCARDSPLLRPTHAHLEAAPREGGTYLRVMRIRAGSLPALTGHLVDRELRRCEGVLERVAASREARDDGQRLKAEADCLTELHKLKFFVMSLQNAALEVAALQQEGLCDDSTWLHRTYAGLTSLDNNTRQKQHKNKGGMLAGDDMSELVWKALGHGARGSGHEEGAFQHLGFFSKSDVDCLGDLLAAVQTKEGAGAGGKQGSKTEAKRRSHERYSNKYRVAEALTAALAGSYVSQGGCNILVCGKEWDSSATCVGQDGKEHKGGGLNIAPYDRVTALQWAEGPAEAQQGRAEAPAAKRPKLSGAAASRMYSDIVDLT
jgi:hypothetical protein